MADDVKRQLQVGASFTVDDNGGGVTKTIENIDSLNNKSKELATAFSNVEKSLANLAKASDGSAGSAKKNSDAYISFVKNLKNEVTSGVKSATEAIEELKKKQKELNLDTNKVNQGEKGYKQYVSQLAEVQKGLDYFNRQIVRQEKIAIDQRKQNIRELDIAYKQSTQDQIASSKKLAQVLETTNKASFTSQVLVTQLIWTGLMKIRQEFSKVAKDVTEIQYNTINNMRLMKAAGVEVTDSLRDGLNSSAATIAKQTGILVTDAQEIQGAWIRINDQYAKSPKLLADISETTAKFMNVGDIESAEDAVKYLNASLLQFNVSATEASQKAEEFANKWAYMADITAVGTADEFGQAIAKYGANIKALNGDMDDAIALAAATGDALAKNGREIGTSLKTFTIYLSRPKSIKLFNEIADSTDDMSFKLADTTGKIKDFDELLSTVGRAYKMYVDQGNDVMANKVVEAMGATRQGDVSRSILNSVTKTAYDENGMAITDELGNAITVMENYKRKSQEAMDNGSYLEQQNAALMESFKNQYNALQVSIQQFGLAMGNAGILDFATSGTKALQSLFDMLGKIPKPILQIVTATTGLKLGFEGLKKLGELTGITNKLFQSANLGTKAEIEHANAIRKTVDAQLEAQRTQLEIQRTRMRDKGATAEDWAALEAQEDALRQVQVEQANLNNTLADGTIRTSEYNAQVVQSVETYNAEITALNAKNAGQNVNNQTKLKSIALTNAEVTAEKKNIGAKITGISTTMRASVAEKQHWAAKTLCIDAEGKSTIAKLRNNAVQSVETALHKKSASSLAIFIATKLTDITVTGLLTVFTTALAGAISLLTNPMVLATAAMALFTYAMGASQRESEKLQKDIDQTSETLDNLRKRIEQLENKGKLEIFEQEALDNAKEMEKSLENTLKIKKQLQADQDWFSGKNGWGKDDDSKSVQIEKDIKNWKKLQKNIEKTQQLIDTYNAIAAVANDSSLTEAERVSAQAIVDSQKADNVFNLEQLDDYYQQALDTATRLQEANVSLGEGISDGIFTDKGLAKAKELYAKLQEISGKTKEVVDQNASDEDKPFSNYHIEDFLEDFDKADEKAQKLKEDIDKLNSGDVDTSDLRRMVQEYDGFKDVISGTRAEQVAFLRALQMDDAGESFRDIQSEAESVSNEITRLKEKANNPTKFNFSDEDVEKCNEEITRLQGELDQLDTMGVIQIQAMLELDTAGLGDVMNQMDNLVNSTQKLTEAQDQLAKGTALSKEQLWGLAQQYPELLYQSNLFNDSSVEGQKNAINSILDMKQQEFNNTVDTKISELELQKEFIQGILDLEQQKADVLAKATVDEANGEVQVKGDLAEILGQYDDLIGQQFQMAEDQKAKTAAKSAEVQADVAGQAGQSVADSSASAGEAVAENITNGAAAGADGMNQNANSIANIFSRIMSWASQLANKIKNALKGEDTGNNSVGGGGAGGIYSNTYTKANYTAGDKTINGMEIGEWIKTQQSALQKNISAYQTQLGNLDNAIGNLEHLKKQGLTGVANNYAGSGSSGSGGKGSGGKSDAEKAIEEAAKAIEKLTEQYIKNVESLQDRIAKALKKKYQEQYDERKKLLEKEHEARVKQIQDEIDKINGETPEDKKSQLEHYQDQFNKWKKDDSTLGKAKQKEYLDKIDELSKEIKIDELEDQLDKENEKFNQSIDKDSEFYDAILKKLDDQMSDEMLYREANDLIRNNKIQEITDLLTKYDAKWDGWASLMGKTAGEIIADEVKIALANYKDVKNGTITPDGGIETNKVTGGSSSTKPSSSSSSSSSSSGGGSISKGRKVRINDTSAGMYYTSTSKGAVNNWKGYTGTYYVVNTGSGRAALGKSNNISSAIGWIDLSKITGLATGGLVTRQGVAMLAENGKERVLNNRQTQAFENLVYNQLPRLDKQYSGANGFGGNNTSINFNKELVSVNVDTVNNYTPADLKNSQDNISKLVTKSLQKSGIPTKIK